MFLSIPPSSKLLQTFLPLEQALIQLFVCRSTSARAHVRSWAPCNDGMLQPVLAEGCWAIRLPAGSELLLCLLTFCTALLCAGGTSLWSLLNCKIHLLLKVIITNAVETNLADSACRQHCPAGLCWLLFPCCFSPWLCKSTKLTPVAVAFPAQLFYFSLPFSLQWCWKSFSFIKSHCQRLHDAWEVLKS